MVYSQRARKSSAIQREPKEQMSSFLDLAGKVALVTGASSGIGAATAKVLAELGANVAFSYHSNQEGAEKVRDEIARAGRKTITIRADVREAEQIRAMVARAMEDLGPIDILVNNAGSLIGRQGILEITEERWNEVIN